jgi:hypothetical protein
VDFFQAGGSIVDPPLHEIHEPLCLSCAVRPVRPISKSRPVPGSGISAIRKPV